MSPRFAILFWYYKSPGVCIDRVRLLRRLNPDLPILGLYGGRIDDFPRFERALAPWLDDNWAYRGNGDAEWKWRHGDQMINHWFLDRGQEFAWDTLIVMQWDMLLLEPADRLFAGLRHDELYLPGLRALDEIESRFWWTKPGTEVHGDFLAFKAWLGEQHGSKAFPLYACQFFTAALPRSFLQRYYAKLFGNPMRDLANLPTAWFGTPPPGKRRTLTTAKADIPPSTIAAECLTPGGARMFHPVTTRFPSSRLGIAAWLGRQATFVLARSLRQHLVPGRLSRGKARSP
ncbi:MAG: hypothetical protein ABS89_06405 [Thiobacillus sp. SCN 63-1177]|nr:MAG: hypothetical protein ABS89_06405 [Thiobacillus sp. SCN 63-1177]